MQISDEKLWKTIESKGMTRTDIRNAARLSSSSYTKLVNDENVTIDILLRICTILDCDISEILRCKK